MKIVEVNWVDSYFLYGWQDKDSCDAEITECTTVGYLFSEDDNQIVVAQNDGGDNVAGCIAIPRSAIRNISLACIAEPSPEVLRPVSDRLCSKSNGNV